MENWKDIQGYEGHYQISDLGRVKSVARTIILPTGGEVHFPEKIMKHRKNKGYWIVNICKASRKFSAKVHRLVAIHFKENPENKPQVNHLFGKDDNRAVAIEWATGSENMKHSFKVGTHISPATRRYNAKILKTLV